MPASLADLIPSRPRRQMSVRQIGFGGGSSSSSSSTPTTRSTSSNGNFLTTDEYLLVDATSDKSFTLDTPSGKKKGYILITAGAGAVTLTPASGTINGAASYIFSGENNTIGILFDGTNWWVTLG